MDDNNIHDLVTRRAGLQPAHFNGFKIKHDMIKYKLCIVVYVNEMSESTGYINEWEIESQKSKKYEKLRNTILKSMN